MKTLDCASSLYSPLIYAQKSIIKNIISRRVE